MRFSQGIESGRFAYVEEAESRSKQYNDIIRTFTGIPKIY